MDLISLTLRLLYLFSFFSKSRSLPLPPLFSLFLALAQFLPLPLLRGLLQSLLLRPSLLLLFLRFARQQPLLLPLLMVVQLAEVLVTTWVVGIVVLDGDGGVGAIVRNGLRGRRHWTGFGIITF